MKFSQSQFVLAICFLLVFGCQNERGAGVESGSAEVAPTSESANTESQEELIEPVAEVAETQAEDSEQSDEFQYINPISKEEAAAGWISLFDGQSLYGWESTNDEVNWSVADGSIVADSGPVGFLMTTVPFKDYELVCEYRAEEDCNSGLFLRSEFPPGDVSKQCYEVNIAKAHPQGFTTGSLVSRKKIEESIETKAGWNEMKVILKGDSAQVFINDKQVLDYTSDENVAAVGRIGLQKNSGKIEFRKVILKPLNLTPLFNGEDLKGWREVPGSKSEFVVKDGEIQVKNGLGFIETDKTFKDFVFQAQAISHAKELNSGFFFRAMKGTEEAPSNGYEFQIHNGFKEDRSQPNNAGTGAIFRRVDARYVVANDNEWFTSTLIANGPRIACWVDGYQVVNWTDERKPDPNPRKGLRLEGGHISIQGHDPTTDLSFKELKISEY